MPDSISNDVRAAILAGMKIQAVKLIREERQLGLAEAIRLVESVWDEVQSQGSAIPQSDRSIWLVTWIDGLAFPGGAVAPGRKRLEAFALVPANWTESDQLGTRAIEAIFSFVYGPRWRLGNDDGSAYVVFNVAAQKLNDGDRLGKPWFSPYDSSTTMRWCFETTDGPFLSKVSGENW